MSDKHVSIGEAARISGLPAKTIRYYEDIGLINPGRRGNGYRVYSAVDINHLHFIKRGRGLGFSIEACRHLLSLYHDAGRESSAVKAIARTHMQEIDEKIAELQAMRRTLSHLIETCHGDARPDCPILDDLAGCHHEEVRD